MPAKEKMPYHQALHAMQAGVAMEMNLDPNPTSPKHLRVGVNAAMCDFAGLVKLLVKKGIITEAEFKEAIEDEMNAEVLRYEQNLASKGIHVTLCGRTNPFDPMGKKPDA